MTTDIVYHGAAYYPELWDVQTLNKDIAFMKRAGINMVRIGEFAWSMMEPNEDEFHFEFLFEIIAKLSHSGIGVILCTPTATPPIWISYQHPERMYCDGGTEISHGARQHVCTNNPYFRERTKILVDQLSKACGNLPGVIGWQIDNEFKCNVAECYCEECTKQWHVWLEKKYKTVENLNRQWGTGVWSQTYQCFEQVPTPKRATFAHNPSLTTNYRLFSREKITEFMRLQADTIRKNSNRPITHNSAVWFQLDNEKLFESLDFVSFDDYPSADQYRQFLFDCDRFRTLKPDVRFLCMETSPGYNGYILQYEPVHPVGFVAAEAAAALSLGACGISYWHFHQHRAGCELTHGSLVSAWGEPTVCFRQVEKASRAIAELKPVLNSTKLVPAEIAIHYSDRARCFMQTENYDGMEYIGLIRRFYDAVLDMGYPRDLLPENGNVSGYKLILTPFMYAVDDCLLEKMLRFVENGGTWLVGPMTGIRTMEHTVHTDAAVTGGLEQAAGVHITGIVPSKGTDLGMEFGGEYSSLEYWVGVFESRGAAVLGKTTGSFLEGQGVLSEMPYGKGRLILLDGMPKNETVLAKILHYAVESSHVAVRVETSENVISAIRSDEHGTHSVICVDMGGKGGKAAFAGQEKSIEPFGFTVITEQNRLP